MSGAPNLENKAGVGILHPGAGAPLSYPLAMARI
jgi:hypothetical protein